MRDLTDRVVFSVRKHEGQWAVESEGAITDRSPDKDVAKAAAHRRARASQDSGRPCIVKVSGEHGFL